jgi:hypothetical protein
MESQGRGGADAHPGVGLDLASGSRDRGRAAVREEGGTDRRDPLVSDRTERRAARSVRVGRAEVGRPAGLFGWASPGCFLFSFSFSS